MRNRILAILMTVAIFVAMGPVEMFAAAGDEGEEAAANEDVLVVEQADEEGASEDIVSEPSEESSEEAAEEAASEEGETAVVEEPAAAEEEAAATEETAEEAPLLRAAAETANVTALTLKAFADKANSITLSWTIAKEGEGKVGPLYLYKGETQIAEIADPVGTTSYSVTGLNQNTAYKFTAKIGDVSSEAVTATTMKVAVPGFRKVSSYKTVILKWSKVAGAAKYIIKVNGVQKASLAASTVTWKHNVGTEKDIINLYNTGKGAKISGNINGKDRFAYTITALDANGVVLAESATTGDIVKTLYYKLTFKSAATLTSHSGGKVTIKVKKGAIVYARGFTDGKYIFDYKCKDGKVRTFYTMKIRVKAALSSHISAIKSKRGTNKQPAYTLEEAEQYVNDRGVKKATTNYMIWANLFSQKEYVFQKKSGKWRIVTANGSGLKNKVMSALPVSTGKATMPTATGSTKINRKLKSQHGTPLWNVTKYFSVHGIQKKWPKPGWPESGACVRNQNPNAVWIYNTIPKYSRVFVH